MSLKKRLRRASDGALLSVWGYLEAEVESCNAGITPEDAPVFRDASEPDPVVKRVSVAKTNLNKPHADYSCGCGACLAWKKRVGW